MVTPSNRTRARCSAGAGLPALLPLLAWACADATPVPVEAGPPNLDVVPIESPAGPGSRCPNLSPGAEGGVVLSWIEAREGDSNGLFVSTFEEDGWGPAHLVAAGEDWFVNWADFPAVAGSVGGGLLGTWLEKNGEGPYAYGVQYSRSTDGGETWSPPDVLHSDRSPTEHGFVSLEPLAAGAFAAVWLDGRHTGDEGGKMALYSAVVDAEGVPTAEVELDSSVCDCCQTASVLLDDGTLIATYRDRSEGEVRDISVVRGRPGDVESWSEPASVHDDGWTIAGCPVNGPAVDARGELVALAWFTQISDEVGRVLVAFSKDGGNRFGDPVQVDDGRPLGRVDTLFLADGTLIVTWLEVVSDGAEWRVLAFPVGAGEPGDSVAIAPVDASRQSGFLRLAPSSEGALAGWTDVGASRVRVARIVPR